MTFELWKYAVRGLYEKDKMTFTLLLALKIDIQGGKIKREEFMTVIKGEVLYMMWDVGFDDLWFLSDIIYPEIM